MRHLLFLTLVVLAACQHRAPVQASMAVPAASIPAPSDVAAPPPGVLRTRSGLAMRVLRSAPAGPHPGPQDRVVVQYTGWTTDGAMFDSSVARGEPATFPLNAVIPGFAEGLQAMVAGEVRRLWIPEELAYQGRSGPPAGMLVFDVELLHIVSTPPTPVWLERPDPAAEVTPSGLASLVLVPGIGANHPGPHSRVTVHYSGWSAEQGMFDSSVTRGVPATFPLSAVIPGWTEGVQLMVVGEQRRFWIPEHLAYQGKPGRPGGLLVFDVELLHIE
ncbi:MAG: FKBP-type peptidyl-prolyl cis-trans isomerase [Pseudomonadota bacterium]